MTPSVTSSDFDLTCGTQTTEPEEKPEEKPVEPVKVESTKKTEELQTTAIAISSAQATVNQDLELVSRILLHFIFGKFN